MVRSTVADELFRSNERTKRKMFLRRMSDYFSFRGIVSWILVAVSTNHWFSNSEFSFSWMWCECAETLTSNVPAERTGPSGCRGYWFSPGSEVSGAAVPIQRRLRLFSIWLSIVPKSARFALQRARRHTPACDQCAKDISRSQFKQPNLFSNVTR